MRILFISDYYPPHIKGGAEISTSLLADWLVTKGHYVSVICSEIAKKPWIEKGIMAYPIIKKVPLGANDVISAVRYAFGIIFLPYISSIRILAHLKRGQPDIINIVPSSYLFIPIALTIRLFTTKPIIIDCRDYSIICPAHLTPPFYKGKNYDDTVKTHHGYHCLIGYKPSNKFLLLFATPFALYKSFIFNSYKSLLRLLVNHSENIYLVGVSKFVAGQLVLNGFSKERVTNIYNISPQSEASTVIEKSELRVPTFAFAGRIEDDKGIWDIIAAAAIVSKKHDQKFRVVIAGAGEDSSQLEEYIKKNNPPNVFLVGKLTPPEVLTLYKESVAIVGPSRWAEPFGRFILEAISVGKPIITTRTGGIAEGVKDGVTGCLVDVGDVQALSDAMASFIQNPEKSIAMRNAILKEARNYEADVIGQLRLALYTKITKES